MFTTVKAWCYTENYKKLGVLYVSGSCNFQRTYTDGTDNPKIGVKMTYVRKNYVIAFINPKSNLDR